MFSTHRYLYILFLLQLLAIKEVVDLPVFNIYVHMIPYPMNGLFAYIETIRNYCLICETRSYSFLCRFRLSCQDISSVSQWQLMEFVVAHETILAMDKKISVKSMETSRRWKEPRLPCYQTWQKRRLHYNYYKNLSCYRCSVVFLVFLFRHVW